MNAKQKAVSLATGIVLAGMVLFPPFQAADKPESVDYNWVWSPQTQIVDPKESADVQAYTSEPTLNVSRLLIQMAVVLVAGAIGVSCLATPEASYMARFHRMEKEMNRRTR